MNNKYNQEQLNLINEYIKLTNHKFNNEKSTTKSLYFISNNNKTIIKTFNEINKYITYIKTNNHTTTTINKTISNNINFKELAKKIITPKPQQEQLKNISFWIDKNLYNQLKTFVKTNNTNINKFLQNLIKEIFK